MQSVHVGTTFQFKTLSEAAFEDKATKVKIRDEAL